MLTRKDIWILFVVGGLAGGQHGTAELLNLADALLIEMDERGPLDYRVKSASRKPKPGENEPEDDDA